MVLAAPLRAAVAVPGFDNAAMDGYAVRGAGPWRLTGDRVLAGRPDPGSLAEGTAVEIATGAPVPAGTDRVVPFEEAHLDGGLVSANDGDRMHIRRAGEDARTGQELVPAGHVVTPAVLGIAAAAGLDLLTVTRRPHVAVLLTGAEIVHSGLPPRGRIRDALGPLLPPMFAGFGGHTTDVRAITDRSADALAAGLQAGECDVLVVVGSSSVGPTDHLRTVLDHLGATLHVDGVACRPGHPQLLARHRQRWIVGLPGNPYAALVAAYTLVQPLIAGLTGRGLPRLPSAAITGPVRPAPGLTRLVPVCWADGGAAVVPGGRPGYLGAAAVADALAIIEADWTQATPAPIILLP